MPDACSPLSLLKGLHGQDRKTVADACRYTERHLGTLLRRTGESYAVHGREVASALRELTQEPSLLAVAVVHDVLMHPDGEALLLSAPLTPEERVRARQLHPLRRLHIDANTQDLDRMMEAFTSEPDLLPIRMAHRLNDIRHLHRFDPTTRRRLANETLHMYTPIAGRLGMFAWRTEMEDLCFRTLQPSIVRHLEEKLAASEPVDRACMDHAKRFLVRELAARGIECTVDARIKGLYSMYRKMVLKKRTFEELMDRIAFRIIVAETEDCYRALGVVHACFHPIPGKLKDYIGAPKENDYRSIHTVVYPLPGITGQPVEIQIRTAAMHQECEYGVARHGEYKNVVYALHAQPARVNLFRNLQSLRQEASTPAQFAQVLRTYFREDHIALFDARSNLYHLKEPVTALDFVCHVHGKRVRRLKTVRVNGRPRPFDILLHDGDTVEAVFARKPSLTRVWLDACKRRAAKQLLRSLLQEPSPGLE